MLQIRDSLDTKFQLKLTVLKFWNKLAQKNITYLKQKKYENHHRILHTRNSLGSKFELQKQRDFSEQIF